MFASATLVRRLLQGICPCNRSRPASQRDAAGHFTPRLRSGSGQPAAPAGGYLIAIQAYRSGSVQTTS